jgi:hypothetical protein
MKLNKRGKKMKHKKLKYNLDFLINNNQNKILDLMGNPSPEKIITLKKLLNDYVTFKVAKQSGLESIEGGETFEVNHTEGGEK